MATAGLPKRPVVNFCERDVNLVNAFTFPFTTEWPRGAGAVYRLAAYAGLLGFKPEKPQAPTPVNPENHPRDFRKGVGGHPTKPTKAPCRSSMARPCFKQELQRVARPASASGTSPAPGRAGARFLTRRPRKKSITTPGTCPRKPRELGLGGFRGYPPGVIQKKRHPSPVPGCAGAVRSGISRYGAAACPWSRWRCATIHPCFGTRDWRPGLHRRSKPSAAMRLRLFSCPHAA